MVVVGRGPPAPARSLRYGRSLGSWWVSCFASRGRGGSASARQRFRHPCGHSGPHRGRGGHDADLANRSVGEPDSPAGQARSFRCTRPSTIAAAPGSTWKAAELAHPEPSWSSSAMSMHGYIECLRFLSPTRSMVARSAMRSSQTAFGGLDRPDGK